LTAQHAPCPTCSASPAEERPGFLVTLGGVLATVATLMLTSRHTELADVWRMLLAAGVGGVTATALATLQAALRRRG